MQSSMSRKLGKGDGGKALQSSPYEVMDSKPAVLQRVSAGGEGAGAQDHSAGPLTAPGDQA